MRRCAWWRDERATYLNGDTPAEREFCQPASTHSGSAVPSTTHCRAASLACLTFNRSIVQENVAHGAYGLLGGT